MRRKNTVLWAEAISAIFGSRVSLGVQYSKRYEVHVTTLVWKNIGRKNGFVSRMLFFELYKIILNKVIFVGFRILDPP